MVSSLRQKISSIDNEIAYLQGALLEMGTEVHKSVIIYSPAEAYKRKETVFKSLYDVSKQDAFFSGRYPKDFYYYSKKVNIVLCYDTEKNPMYIKTESGLIFNLVGSTYQDQRASNMWTMFWQFDPGCFYFQLIDDVIQLHWTKDDTTSIWFRKN